MEIKNLDLSEKKFRLRELAVLDTETRVLFFKLSFFRNLTMRITVVSVDNKHFWKSKHVHKKLNASLET